MMMIIIITIIKYFLEKCQKLLADLQILQEMF